MLLCSTFEDFIAYDNLETECFYVQSSVKCRPWPDMCRCIQYASPNVPWEQICRLYPTGDLETELNATCEYTMLNHP